MEVNKRIELLKSTAFRDYTKAFSLFFILYYERLVRFATPFLGARCCAEDAVSEVLIRLFRKKNELFLIDNFEAYLFRSVKNEVINKLRAERNAIVRSTKISLKEIMHDCEDPHEKFLEQELSHRIDHAVGQLPAQRQKVYRLIKDDGMRYKDVARLMEISERTVEVHLKLAVREVQYAVALYLHN